MHVPSNLTRFSPSGRLRATPYSGRVSSPPATMRRTAYAALGPAAAVACVGVLVGLLIGHGAQAPLAGLLDPGAVVRWGLPVVRTVHDLAAALTIGSLVLAAVALPEQSRPAALRIAATSGIVWVAGGRRHAGADLRRLRRRHARARPGSAPSSATSCRPSTSVARCVTSLLLAFVVATGAAMARSLNAIGWLAVAQPAGDPAAGPVRARGRLGRPRDGGRQPRRPPGRASRSGSAAWPRSGPVARRRSGRAFPLR